MRLFILSDSPPEKDVQWSEEGITSSYKFLQKLWTLNTKMVKELEKEHKKDNGQILRKFTHQFVKKITENLNNFSYNIAIANLHEMQSFLIKELDNEYTKDTLLENYCKILAAMMPVIPHFSSECLDFLNIKTINWPDYDEKILEESEANFVIQVNGKKRGIIKADKQILENDLLNLIKKDNKLFKYFENKKINKSIFIPKKLINFIIKDD